MKTNLVNEHYYKFRSLWNLKYFSDIITNERLYAARYDELNDPMEGAFLIDYHRQNIVRLLKNEKYKTRICSLSQDYRHTLLWSHYADSHKGCCIEVSSKKFNEVPTKVQYVKELPEIEYEEEGKALLSHKSILWQYENEVRFFRKTNYFNVNIHSIIFGQKMSNGDYKFYEKLINAINPNIQVRKILKEEIIDGFERK